MGSMPDDASLPTVTPDTTSNSTSDDWIVVPPAKHRLPKDVKSHSNYSVHDVPAFTPTKPSQMVSKSLRRLPFTSNSFTTAMKRIVDGYKVVVILRGPPGSGKSTLAKQLCHSGQILSTDDFWMSDGGAYGFDRSLLGEAHTWNRERCVNAMERGVTPIIIDNTNCQVWEMQPYVLAAATRGYDIHFIEPDTPWKFNANELFKRNTHGVERETIQYMVETFDKNVTLSNFGLERYLIRPSTSPKGDGSSARGPLSEITPPPGLERPTFSTTSAPPGLAKSPDFSALSQLLNRQSQNETLADPWTVPGSSHLNVSQTSNEASGTTWQDEKETDTSSTTLNWEVNDVADSGTAAPPTAPVPVTEPKTQKVRGRPKQPRERLIPVIKSDNWKELSGQFANPVALPAAMTTPVVPAGRLMQWQTRATQTDDKIALSAMDLDTSADGFDLSGETFVSGNRDRLFDRSAQTEDEQDFMNIDEQFAAAQQLPGAAGIGWLQTLFPRVSLENLQYIFDTCNSDARWAADVLMESGYTKTDIERTVDDPLADVLTAQIVAYTPSHQSLAGPSDNTEEAFMDIPVSRDLVTRLQNAFSWLDILTSDCPEVFNVHIPLRFAEELYCYCSSALYERKERLQSQATSELDTSNDESIARYLQRQEQQLAGLNVMGTGASDTTQPSLQAIMEEERAMQQAARKAKPLIDKMDTGTGTVAYKMKFGQLCEVFPNINHTVLRQVFDAQNGELEPAVSAVCDAFHAWPEDIRKPTASAVQGGRDSPKAFLVEQNVTYQEARKEAQQFYEQRTNALRKAAHHRAKGIPQAASIYRQEALEYSKLQHEANERAARLLLRAREAQNPPHVLDLHGLHVPEATSALANFLTKNMNRLQAGRSLQIITGAGVHSMHGQARLRPAVEGYLRNRRDLNVRSENQGMFEVSLKRDWAMMTR